MTHQVKVAMEVLKKDIRNSIGYICGNCPVKVNNASGEVVFIEEGGRVSMYDSNWVVKDGRFERISLSMNQDK